ncbi:MAG: hypothetical protein MI863_15930 [Desulfobacterales bacterium]|nr:hypothetical protein [Desulfobacterales bacterium]
MQDIRIGFRESILGNDKECLVHCADNLAQFTRAVGHISSKSDRSLACAAEDDIVVLDHPLDTEYQAWLRSLSLGTDHVVVYESHPAGKTVSELIVNDPAPVLAMIKETGKQPVYLPWYSGPWENKAAGVIGADLFGASASLTVQYNEKSLFKQLCRELGIPVVEDTCFRMGSGSHQNLETLQGIVAGYLSDHPRVLARAAMDNTGVSMAYVTDGADLEALYGKWRELGIDKLIIEPFLTVRHSPCGQWIVTREKEIVDTGMVNQMLSDLWHQGSIKTDTIPEFDWEPVQSVTLKLAQHMAASGYIGFVGIDFIETDSGVFPVENNARLNGSSYVKLIVERIEALSGPVSCWKSLKAKTSPCSFQQFIRKTEAVLYDGKKSRGYFPYNCEKLGKTGDFALILMGPDLEAIADLEGEINRLGVF